MAGLCPKETLHLSHEPTYTPLLTQMDSGNDVKENLGIVPEDGNWFIVKRNSRTQEAKDKWLTKVEECYKDVRKPCDGKHHPECGCIYINGWPWTNTVSSRPHPV